MVNYFTVERRPKIGGSVSDTFKNVLVYTPSEFSSFWRAISAIGCRVATLVKTAS